MLFHQIRALNQISSVYNFVFSCNLTNTFVSCIITIHVVLCITSQTSDRGSLNVEMSAESLDTMLDSLAKIRDQISSVTQ